MVKLTTLTLLAFSFLFGVLTVQADEKKEFRFPPGDIEKGSEVFAALSCVQCHSVKGVHFEDPPDRRIDVVLAGEDGVVTSYEELLRAISNPKHVVQKKYEAILSKTESAELVPLMEDFTTRMTLRQFIDLVTFLDRAYSISAEDYGKKGKE